MPEAGTTGGAAVRLVEWLRRLFGDPDKARRLRRREPDESRTVPPWERPSDGRRLTPGEATERRKPRPGAPWEREADRDRRRREKAEEDAALRRRYKGEGRGD